MATAEALPRVSDAAPRRVWVVAGVFVSLAVLVALSQRRPGGPIDFFEDGQWLGTASDMLAGKVPYRDTFPLHGFLADGGLDWLLFSLLGPSLALSRSVHFFVGVLFHPSLYLVAAAATRRPWLAATAIPLNFGLATQIVADRPVFPLLALAAFLWAIDAPARRGRAFAAGVLSAIGLMYALEFGTFVVLAEVAALALYRFPMRGSNQRVVATRSWGLGLALVLVPFAAILAGFSALLPFLRTSFYDLPHWIHSVWGMDFPAPWTVAAGLWKGSPYRVGALAIGPGVAKRLYLDPLLGGIGVVVAMAFRRRLSSPATTLRLLTLSLACAAWFRYVVARLHVEVGDALTGPLLLTLLVVGHEALAPSLSIHGRRRLAVALTLVGCVAGIAMNAVARTAAVVADARRYTGRMANRSGLVLLEGERGGSALVAAGQAREIAALDDWARASLPRDAAILELTNRPALYFLLRRRNALRFYQVPMVRPFQQEVIAELRRRPPAAVLLQHDTPFDTTDGVPNPIWIPQVWRYIDETYPRRIRVGETVIALPPDQDAAASH